MAAKTSMVPAGAPPKLAEKQTETVFPRVPLIEGYRIIDKLGEGGMGSVWRAEQLATEREVALKMIHPNLLGSDISRRTFKREIRLAARLEHPNVARVYDAGMHEGVCFYAMQFVRGDHLDQYVWEHELDERQIAALIAIICRAVAFAHKAGTIHRDLKPSNIVVDEHGTPYILDFGLAKSFVEGDRAGTISSDGSICGTLRYMSPEQAAGRIRQVRFGTDIYSLAVVLYHLLTKEFPHDLSGSTYDVLKRIAEDDVIPPGHFNPDISPDLQVILHTCLQRRPEDRYGSAHELANDIDRFLEGGQVSARALKSPL